MTTPTNPGSPRMEPLAFERLRTLIADELGEKPYASDLALRLATQLFSSMRFDHDINSHGVPARRVLAYGQWEVDPNPPKHHVQTGDIVCFVEHEDGEVETLNYGRVPPGQAWTVSGVLFKALDPSSSLLKLKLPEWPDSSFITALGGNVVIMKRPHSKV